uniref:Uncharacterized protein n=1 Tax=Glossina brevipalpis TaxID=37001 RepID=A0A1A9WVQ8_9MUSC
MSIISCFHYYLMTSNNFTGCGNLIGAEPLCSSYGFSVPTCVIKKQVKMKKKHEHDMTAAMKLTENVSIECISRRTFVCIVPVVAICIIVPSQLYAIYIREEIAYMQAACSRSVIWLMQGVSNKEAFKVPGSAGKAVTEPSISFPLSASCGSASASNTLGARQCGTARSSSFSSFSSSSSSDVGI